MPRPSITVRVALILLSLNFALLAPAALVIALQRMPFPTWFWRQFNPNEEANLIAWYSSALLLLLAAMCAVHFCVRLDQPVRSAARYGWLLLCLLATALSFEETACVHEGVGHMVHRLLPNHIGMSSCHVWVLAYSPFILGAVVTLSAGAFRLRGDRTSRNMMLAGTALWLLAVALEAAEVGRTAPSSWHLNAAELLEEALEIFGATLLLLAALRLAEVRFLGRLRLSEGPGSNYDILTKDRSE